MWIQLWDLTKSELFCLFDISHASKLAPSCLRGILSFAFAHLLLSRPYGLTKESAANDKIPLRQEGASLLAWEISKRQNNAGLATYSLFFHILALDAVLV